jgi:hypothetical protein
MNDGSSPPGWYQDPTGQSDGRYWNGTSWTQMSMRGGQTLNLAIDPSIAEAPPVPGTQVAPPAPPPAESSSGGSGGVIIAIVIGLLLLLAVFVAVDDDTSTDTPAPGGSVPAEEPPAEEPPAEEPPAEEPPAEEE